MIAGVEEIMSFSEKSAKYIGVTRKGFKYAEYCARETELISIKWIYMKYPVFFKNRKKYIL